MKFVIGYRINSVDEQIKEFKSDGIESYKDPILPEPISRFFNRFKQS